MKPYILAMMALTVALVMSAPVEAQQRWSVEFRLGAAMPTQDVGDAEIRTGFGFEGSLGYRLLPHLGVYGGWDWHRFRPDDAFAGVKTDLEETGYAFGLRFEHPFTGETGNGAAYRIQAGGTYNHLEVENRDGNIIADSGHGFGWEVGAGVSFPVADRWRITPGVRYRALSRDLEMDGITKKVDLNLVAFEVGFSRRF